MTPPTVNAYYDRPTTTSTSGGHPPAAVLRREGRRRGQLRRDRSGRGPRADARLRRRGPSIRRQGKPQQLVDDEGPSAFEARSKGSSISTRSSSSPRIRARSEEGRPRERRADLGRKHGRQRGHPAGVRGLQEGARGRFPRHGRFTPEQRFFLGFGQIWCENQTEQSARLQVFDPHPPSNSASTPRCRTWPSSSRPSPVSRRRDGQPEPGARLVAMRPPPVSSPDHYSSP